MAQLLAIIGAGISGLAAAKAAKEEGLAFEVFEQATEIGGVWRKDGATWDGMITNITHHTANFSDFPILDQAMPDFLSKEMTLDYLHQYATSHDLHSHIHFNSRIINISRYEDNWEITWKCNDRLQRKIFSAVVIATGRYSKPFIPSIKGLELFQGEKIHSASYRSAQYFANKNVLIVGNSFSGIAIAEEIAATKQSKVTMVMRRPRWILSRYLSCLVGKEIIKVPYDLLKTRMNASTLDEKQMHAYFSQHCIEQNSIPSIRMEENSDFNVAIGDEFVDYVREGLIDVINSQIDNCSQDKVILKNNKTLTPDSIIFCTGFTSDFSYFDAELQEKLQPQLLRRPTIFLYEHTFHPAFPNMAFLGLSYQNHGAIAPSAELQARFACGVFSGRLALPNDMENHVEEMIDKRYGLEVNDNLAKQAEVFPEVAEIEKFDKSLATLITQGTCLPAHFRLMGFGEKRELAKKIILEKAALIKNKLQTQKIE